MNALFEQSSLCIARSRTLLVKSQAVLEEANRFCAFLQCLGAAPREQPGMTANDELRQMTATQIKMKREAAARARRLAAGFWSFDDRQRALSFAEKMDAQANELAAASAG
jgi:hypothetical protein